jgi:hypothetical protein
MTTVNPFQTNFNVKQFNITTNQIAAPSVAIKAEHNYLETMHKGA